MLTYLKPGDIYQKNDVLEGVLIKGEPSIFVVGSLPPGPWPTPGNPVDPIDMNHKPRRWRLDADCLYMTLPGWATVPGALNE